MMHGAIMLILLCKRLTPSWPSAGVFSPFPYAAEAVQTKWQEASSSSFLHFCINQTWADLCIWTTSLKVIQGAQPLQTSNVRRPCKVLFCFSSSGRHGGGHGFFLLKKGEHVPFHPSFTSPCLLSPNRSLLSHFGQRMAMPRKRENLSDAKGTLSFSSLCYPAGGWE